MHDGGAVRIDAVTKPTPIYVLGDSHVLGFKDLFFRDTYTGGDYYTVSRYYSGFAAGGVSSGGALVPAFVKALEYEGLLKEGRAAHLRVGPMDLAVAYASGSAQVPPLIIVCCGDIDLRGHFFQYIKEECDLILPFETPYPATGKPPLPYDVALQLVRERLEPLVAGLKTLHDLGLVRTYLHTVAPPTLNAELFRQVHGFDCPAATRYKAAVMYNQFLTRRCKELGVPVLDVWPEVTRDGYLRPEYELDGVHLAREANLISLRALVEHALNNTPPIRNVERYRLLYEMATGRTDHVYDVSTGMNSYGSLPAAPEPEAAPAAPPPPEPVPAAVAAPAKRGRLALLPGTDQTPCAPIRARPAPKADAPPVVESRIDSAPKGPPSVLTVPAIVPTAPAPRVETAAPEAESADPFVRAARRFKAEWVCTLDLGRELAEKWRNSVDYRLDLANRHARLDWAGNGLAPYNDYIRTAEPSAEFLDEVRNHFSSERFTRFFHDCFGCLVTFLNFRPFMSLPHEDKGVGPQSWHEDGCPPGVFRAVIYLTDVDADAGPFEYLDADKKRRSVTGPAGALLVFDANRLRHRGSPPKRTERKVLDIVIAPRADGQPFTVLWTGLNNWPGDPFQYSVSGMKASPPLTGSELSFKPRAAA